MTKYNLSSPDSNELSLKAKHSKEKRKKVLDKVRKQRKDVLKIGNFAFTGKYSESEHIAFFSIDVAEEQRKK